MTIDPNYRDPRDPAADPIDPRTGYVDPRQNTTVVRNGGGSRAGLALAAVLAALLVIGFVAFTGNDSVDPNTTASTPGATTEQTVRPSEPVAPSATQPEAAPATPPAAAPAPADNMAPTPATPMQPAPAN